MNKKSDRENCHYSSYSIAAKKFNFGLFMMHTNPIFAKFNCQFSNSGTQWLVGCKKVLLK